MRKGLNGLDHFATYAAVVLFSALVLLMFAEVITRYVLGFSISGMEEIALLSMIFGVFIAAGAILRIDGHIRMSLVADMFKGKSGMAIRLAGNVITLAVAVVLLVSACLFVGSQYSTGAISISLQLPMWIYFLCVPIGSLLLVIHAIEVVVRDVFRLASRPGVNNQ